MAKRPGFWRFSWRSLMTGTDRVGHFSQHDRLVGTAIIGGILVGPLVGGLIGIALGIAAVLVPSAILAVIVIAAVFALGAYGQWQQAEDRTDLQRDEAGYYKRIIEGQHNREENQKIKADLLDEGLALVVAILTGGDDQLSAHRVSVQEWRERARDFLNKESSGGVADGATFFRSFDLSNSTAFIYRGSTYTGDRATLASQVNDAMGTLSGMYIPENTYLSFTAVKAMEDAEANVEARRMPS